MSDCAQGGRIAYERPGDALELRIDFEGETAPWTHPLALNGCAVEKVTVGGVEYGPQEDYFETVFADGGLRIEAVVMGDARYERVVRCRDCLWYEEEWCTAPDGEGNSKDWYVGRDDFFCAFGAKVKEES